MPFCYHNIVDPTNPNEAQSYIVTDHNLPPALVLWLLVTTNNGFRNTPGTPGSLSDDARQRIADQLGVTKYTVDFFIAQANAHDDEFSTVNSVFASIATTSGYSGPGCPHSPAPIMMLAPSAQVEDPGEDDPGE